MSPGRIDWTSKDRRVRQTRCHPVSHRSPQRVHQEIQERQERQDCVQHSQGCEKGCQAACKRSLRFSSFKTSSIHRHQHILCADTHTEPRNRYLAGMPAEFSSRTGLCLSRMTNYLDLTNRGPNHRFHRLSNLGIHRPHHHQTAFHIFWWFTCTVLALQEKISSK